MNVCLPVCVFLFVLEMDMIESKSTFTSVGYMMLFDLLLYMRKRKYRVFSHLFFNCSSRIFYELLLNINTIYFAFTLFHPEYVHVAFDGHLHDVCFQTNKFDPTFNILISFLCFIFGVGDDAHLYLRYFCLTHRCVPFDAK